MSLRWCAGLVLAGLLLGRSARCRAQTCPIRHIDYKGKAAPFNQKYEAAVKALNGKKFSEAESTFKEAEAYFNCHPEGGRIIVRVADRKSGDGCGDREPRPRAYVVPRQGARIASTPSSRPAKAISPSPRNPWTSMLSSPFTRAARTKSSPSSSRATMMRNTGSMHRR